MSHRNKLSKLKSHYYGYRRTPEAVGAIFAGVVVQFSHILCHCPCHLICSHAQSSVFYVNVLIQELLQPSFLVLYRLLGFIGRCGTVDWIEVEVQLITSEEVTFPHWCGLTDFLNLNVLLTVIDSTVVNRRISRKSGACKMLLRS